VEWLEVKLPLDKEKHMSRYVMAESGLMFPEGFDPLTWKFESFSGWVPNSGKKANRMAKVSQMYIDLRGQALAWVNNHPEIEVVAEKADRFWQCDGTATYYTVFYKNRPTNGEATSRTALAGRRRRT
jgi:hypothetical protein